METLQQIKALYKEKGLKAVNGYIKTNNIPVKVNVCEFGLDGVNSRKEKEFWLNESSNSFRCHLYSVSKKSRRTGYSYNVIRGKEIILL